MVKYWLQLTNWQLVITNRKLLESDQRFLEMNFYSYLLMYAVYSAAVLILLFYFELRIMYEIIWNSYRTRGTLVHRCSAGTSVREKGLYKKINNKKINQLKVGIYFISLWYNYCPHGKAECIGDKRGLVVQKDGTKAPILMKNVNYVLQLYCDLFSIMAALGEGCKLVGDIKSLKLSKKGQSYVFDRKVKSGKSTLFAMKITSNNNKNR